MPCFLPVGRALCAMPEKSMHMHIRAFRTARPVCAASLCRERSESIRAAHIHTHIISARPDHIVPGAFAYFLLLQRRSRFIHRSLRRRRRA